MIKLTGRIQPKRLFGSVHINLGAANSKLQAKTVAPSQEDVTVFPDTGFTGLSYVIVEGATLQEKTVTPSSQEQTVVPDVGVYGLAKVIVKPQGEHGLLEDIVISPKEEEQVFTPPEGYYGIDRVTVEGAPLEEVTIYPAYEPQTITPSEGYYGIGSILVEAMPEIEDPDSGGGWGDDYGGSVEDTTWGDEYYDTEVPTGNLDYSGGTDENPSYIPEIPGEGEYKVLFRNTMKAGTTFRYSVDGVEYEVKTTSDCILYAASGECMGTDDNGGWRNGYFEVILYSGSESCTYYHKKVSDLSWVDGNTTRRDYAEGYFAKVYYRVNIKREFWGNDLSTGFEYNISGIPYFNLGICADSDSRLVAMYSCASRGGDSETEQFIAFVSKTPIYYDGTHITNADGSPMSIYNVDAANGNEWVYTGATDGTNFPVGGYELTWNNHDLKDMDGENITELESGDPVPEMTDGQAPSPVERSGTYSVDGATMNGLVSSAQKVTGSTTPLTPTEASAALADYMANPAEEMKW